MKLYYIVDKWRIVKNNGIIVPILEKDNIYNSYNTINLFNKLFDDDITEIFDEENLKDFDMFNFRIFSLYSIETSNLDLNFSLVNNEYNYILKILNENINLIEHKEKYFYSSEFHNLDWKLEKTISINKNKFKSKFLFNDNNNTKNNDIKILLNIIIDGDLGERLLKLNNIINNFNIDIKNCAKELYEIFYQFSCSDYFDINSEGNVYYNAMKFLRDKYNIDE